MARTIIYPQGKAAWNAQTDDDYASKLLKYIPAEVIAFYAPAYALTIDNKIAWLQILFLFVGAGGTVGYLFVRHKRENPVEIKPFYFFALGLISFLIWAVGTSSVLQDVLLLLNPKFVVPELASKAILSTGVFVIPLLDELLTHPQPQVTSPDPLSKEDV